MNPDIILRIVLTGIFTFLATAVVHLWAEAAGYEHRVRFLVPFGLSILIGLLVFGAVVVWL